MEGYYLLNDYLDPTIEDSSRRKFMIFPYYPMGDLMNLIEKSRSKGKILSTDTLGYLIRNMAEAVYEMHYKANLAHCDIKLQNIVLDNQFIPRLIDFQYSSYLTRKSLSYLGTPGYIAPEIKALLGQSDPSQRKPYNKEQADVYALGVSIKLLIHHQLFQNKEGFGIIRSWLLNGFSSKLCSQSMCEFSNALTDDEQLNRCIADEPDQRPKMVELIKHMRSREDLFPLVITRDIKCQLYSILAKDCETLLQ